MINKVKDTINKYNLVPQNETILVALSGGVDSMCLLDVLKKLNYKIVVAHVNHKKRLESEFEEEAIKELCKKLDIKCEVLHLEHLDGNFQSGAHHRRYEFFIEIAKKYNIKYIATAHHADDNIETIFLNLMSGSNLYGYGGISPSLLIDDIKIIRPFLNVSKQEIKAYATANNIKYYEDYTNSTDDYKRNRIRHHVIPILKEECPNILDKVRSYSMQIHKAFSFVRNQSINYLDKHNNTINISDFKNLDTYLKEDIICLLLERYDIERSENLINDIIAVIDNNKPQVTYNLKNDMVLKKRYEIIEINKLSNTSSFKYILKSIDDKIETNKFQLYFSKVIPNDCTKYIKLCYNKIEFPLIIRSRNDGDEIHMPYGHKKIKDLFIDKKINKELRESIPIVVDNNNSILWVINIAKSKEVFDQKENGNIYLVYKETNHDN